ncbi:hypothetical protein [Methanolapillus africanus]
MQFTPTVSNNTVTSCSNLHLLFTILIAPTVAVFQFHFIGFRENQTQSV